MAIGGANIVTGTENSIFCDNQSDVADLEDFARERRFAQGSTCLCIETGEVYCMKSDYTWKII